MSVAVKRLPEDQGLRPRQLPPALNHHCRVRQAPATPPAQSGTEYFHPRVCKALQSWICALASPTPAHQLRLQFACAKLEQEICGKGLNSSHLRESAVNESDSAQCSHLRDPGSISRQRIR